MAESDNAPAPPGLPPDDVLCFPGGSLRPAMDPDRGGGRDLGGFPSHTVYLRADEAAATLKKSGPPE